MTKPRTFKDLEVWNKALKFAAEIYQVTQPWPREEAFGLTSQIHRAAVSVPGNIAEGAGRGNCPDRSRFLRIAAGSLAEVRTYIELAVLIGYFTSEIADELEIKADSIAGMLYKFINSNDLKT